MNLVIIRKYLCTFHYLQYSKNSDNNIIRRRKIVLMMNSTTAILPDTLQAQRLITTGISLGLLHVLAGPDHLSALAALSVGSSYRFDLKFITF